MDNLLKEDIANKDSIKLLCSELEKIEQS